LNLTFGTLLRLLIACLVVGVILAWLDLRPPELAARLVGGAEDLGRLLMGLVDRLFDSAGDIVGYVLLGAVVVIPVWLASLLLQAIRRRR
jgi:hypothetical protein